MVSRRSHSAVMAALLEGQSISTVAAGYKIPPGTVKRWRSDSKHFSEPVEPQKKEEIGNLLLDYLKENLVTLHEQSQHFRNKAWLDGQSAADLAVLHGVLADKSVRLLEALGADSGAVAQD